MENFEFVYNEGETRMDHLKCKHCGEKVERGIANVADHWLSCEKRTEGLIVAKDEEQKKFLQNMSFNTPMNGKEKSVETINWNPSPIKDGRTLSTELMKPLLKKYGNDSLEDGIFLSENDIDWFEGLAYGGVKDANFIVDKIRLHGRIEIRVRNYTEDKWYNAYL